MPEELFTKSELTEIANEAIKPIYSEPNFIHLGKNKTSIRGVSQSNGLIMAYGNSDTGFKHIYERHSPASRTPYWENPNKIGDPTKFALNFVPVDYLYVASQIFKDSNISTEKNKRPKLFDLFIGSFKHRNGREVEYRLFVYKQSKVIHTFFINENSRPFNKKKVLNLKQGWVSGNNDLFNDIQTFCFSYFDSDNIEQVKVIIRYNGNTKKERWYIQVNPIKERPYLTYFIDEKNVLKSDQFMVNLFSYEYENVTWIEKIIKSVLNNKIEY